MKEKIARRDFLKISGATVIGGAAAYAGLKSLESKPPGADGENLKETVVPTFCEICFWKCGVLAHVKGGQVTKIEGNPLHPLSNGKLCPRGVGGIGALTDPDRLRQPLIRTKVNGKEKWKVATWDEALEFTAKKLLGIRKKSGAGSVALYSHGHGGSFFKTFMKAFGSGVITAPSYDQCRGPRSTGYSLTYGRAVGSPELIDVANSKCVAFLGSHLGENMHNTPVQEMSRANDDGAVFITVDPRFSIIASKSKYWLPIRPGTDIALLSAWANVMIEEGIYQKDFVKNNVHGFGEFKKWVSDKTPEWAYIETGIEPELIRETARELAKNAPQSLIHPGRRVVWYGDDTQRSRMNAIVNALLGNFGKKGGFYLPSKLLVKKYKLPAYPPPAGFDSPEATKYPLASKILAQGVCDASVPNPLTSADAAIRSWIVYGCNVPMTLPNPSKVIEAMKKLEFVAVIDTMPAEVTGYADVILPECTYLERYDDLHNPSYRTPYVAIRQPVVKPRDLTKPGWWIAKKLAEKMDKLEGNNAMSKYFPWNNIEEYIKTRLKKSGLSFEQLKRDGVIVKKGDPIYDNSPKMKFKTPSGKIEFVSGRLHALGFDPIPAYTRHEEPPDGYFRLLFGRAPVHTFTRTTNNRVLLEMFPENEVWLNAAMAKIDGFKNGEYVLLENQDGKRSGPVKLKVTERIRQDCVFMAHGFGREENKALKRDTGLRLRGATGRGASDSHLITRVKRDPIMGGTGMNVNFVRIVKA